MKQETEYLFVELKTELHKSANTHTGKVYFRRQRYKTLSMDTERGCEEPQKVGITAVDIFIWIDLFICGWLGARCV